MLPPGRADRIYKYNTEITAIWLKRSKVLQAVPLDRLFSLLELQLVKKTNDNNEKQKFLDMKSKLKIYKQIQSRQFIILWDLII